jgi:hypothetical protein
MYVLHCWNFCLRYVPNCNILTTAKNQYIDYLLFLVMTPLYWDDSWRFGLNIKTMSGCLLTSYMRTQYLVLFYIVMNVWPVVYLGRYTSLVSTSLTVKYNTRRAINNIFWNWIPTPRSSFIEYRLQGVLLLNTDSKEFFYWIPTPRSSFKPLNIIFPFDCTDFSI